MSDNRPISEQFREAADRLSAFEARCIPEPNSGCWLWLGMIQQGKEYGLFCWKRKTIRAHRGAWELYRGRIPQGMHVCHGCDVPSCVNPDHLFLGTHADNMMDMHSKGRFPTKRGSAQWAAKLTEERIPEIWQWRLDGVSTKMIAERLGVNKSTIERVLRGETWKHV